MQINVLNILKIIDILIIGNTQMTHNYYVWSEIRN